MRAVAAFAGFAFVVSALPASAATPRTTAIVWADCRYGLERAPIAPLSAYAVTQDGRVTRTRSAFSSSAYEPLSTESAVIGPERFRRIADRIDGSTLFEPPVKPTPDANGLVEIGRTITDTRGTHLAFLRDNAWDTWSLYRLEQRDFEAVRGLFDAVFNPKLAWHEAPRRSNPFGICQGEAPIQAMTVPAQIVPGVSEITVAQCHAVESADAPRARAYHLTPSGAVARTTTTKQSQMFLELTEVADVGSATYAAVAERLTKAGFFAKHASNVNADGGDTRGEFLSAKRDGRRTTWNSARSSSSWNYSDVLYAVTAAVSDPALSWKTVKTDQDAFVICDE
jgi:hypothetical protein